MIAPFFLQYLIGIEAITFCLPVGRAMDEMASIRGEQNRPTYVVPFSNIVGSYEPGTPQP